MKIDKNDPRLTAYVLNELNAADRAVIEQAIQENPELKQEIEDLKRGTALLSQLQAQETYRLTPEQREKVFAAFEKKSSWSWLSLSGGLVAACLAIMLFKRTTYETSVQMAPAPAPLSESVPEPKEGFQQEAEKPKKMMQAPARAELQKDKSTLVAAEKEIAADMSFNEDALAKGSGGAAPTESVAAARAAPAPAAPVQWSLKMVLVFPASIEKEVSDRVENQIQSQLAKCFPNSIENLSLKWKLEGQKVTEIQVVPSTTQAHICVLEVLKSVQWPATKSNQFEYKLQFAPK